MPESKSLARPTRAAVTPWNPWNEFAHIRQEMDELFNRSFNYTPLWRMFPMETEGYQPDVDIRETEKTVEMFVTAPGFTPEQINVETTPDTITIKGDRQSFYEPKEGEREKGWASSATSLYFCCDLPSMINSANVKATLKDGVLHLSMPKAAEAKKNVNQIKVKPA